MNDPYFVDEGDRQTTRWDDDDPRLKQHEEFVQIGWISHGMKKTRVDHYKSMFGSGIVRIPPKIYKTESIAARYGKAVPVFIKNNEANPR